MKILHLTLKQPYFDQIASGVKRIEYRDMKPYWTKRLNGRQFDEIHFHNGYRHDSPFMRVEWNGMYTSNGQYCIRLGRVLEVRTCHAAGYNQRGGKQTMGKMGTCKYPDCERYRNCDVYRHCTGYVPPSAEPAERDCTQESLIPLLPCPFCGGEASAEGKITYGVHDAYWEDGERITEAFFVNCLTCGCTNQGLIGHRTQGDAIAHWNKRHGWRPPDYRAKPRGS